MLVFHGNLTSFLQITRPIELHTKQLVNLARQFIPSLRLILAHNVTKIPQHLGGAAFTDAHVEGTWIQPGFNGSQAGHGRQERHVYLGGLLWNRHPLPTVFIKP